MMCHKKTTGQQLHPDFYYGIVLLIIGGGLLFHTMSERYDFDLLFGDVSTVFFPRIILIMWVLLSGILIANGLRGRGNSEDHARFKAVDIGRFLLVLVVIVVAAIVLWLIGLLIGGPLMMIAVGLSLGYRRLVLLVPVSVTIPVIIWFALGEVARISLPSGVLWN
jgi:hypothetical protein